MTQQDLKDIIGFIEAHPDVYIYRWDTPVPRDGLGYKVIFVKHIAGTGIFSYTPEAVHQDIREYL